MIRYYKKLLYEITIVLQITAQNIRTIMI